MSFLVYYLIFHLCVSMYACNSRQLGVYRNEPANEVRPIIEEPEKMVELEGKNIYEYTVQQKESTLVFHSKRTETDIQVQISQEETKAEGWKNHGRSTMESKQQDSKEAINKYKDSSFIEDVVVMDYAQPHRKPPIHNIDP